MDIATRASSRGKALVASLIIAAAALVGSIAIGGQAPEAPATTGFESTGVGGSTSNHNELMGI